MNLGLFQSGNWNQKPMWKKKIEIKEGNQKSKLYYYFITGSKSYSDSKLVRFPNEFGIVPLRELE